MSKRERGAHLPLHPSIGTHEVFISHCGMDMKRKFANHLYHSLKRRGIKAFLDMEELPEGQDVRPFMLEAAQRAIIQVPIFTRIYAESCRCLDELVEMMKSSSHTKVFPVFYDVKSEELREKDGPFGKAIQAHREEGKLDEGTIKGWEEALCEASWLEGFRLETYNYFEGALLNDLVAKIVEEMQDKTPVVEDRNAVGLEERVHDVVELLHLEEKRNVYFVLVWGMGGVGKTTLARAIYKRLGKEFEAASLVENCGYEKPRRIQDRLLEDLLLHKDFLEADVGKRRERLRRGLREKEVLIILDDVKTNFDFVEEVIDLSSLHPGSRILVTSRNQRVFPHMNDFSHVFRAERYELQCMDDDKSLLLFCLHAFRKNSPDPGFERLAMKVSKACGGLPLSLEVLGRHLTMRKEKEIWEEAITLLRSSKYQGISGRLMISYEALTEDEQEMFLDVACFLIGEHEECAKYFWDGLIEGWRTGLKRLVELCLVKVGEEERLTMHDHLRDLGRGIVRKESKKSGKWSRLWDDEDLSLVLQRKQGLDQICGLATSLSNLNAGLLSQMQSLRLLFLVGTCLDGDSEGIQGLQITWLKCQSHFKTLPNEIPVAITKLLSSFGQLKKLRKLEMAWCKGMKELPEGFGCPESLEELDVSGSAITKLPSSFRQLKKLRKLDMLSCQELKELPEGFGCLESLEELDVSFSAITKLPSSFGQLKKLRRLDMGSCKWLLNLPEGFGCLESLEEWDVSSSAISKLPSSFGQLKKLRKLVMWSCNQLKELPEGFRCLESLEELNVRYSAITKLPTFFGQLKKLRKLDMGWCEGLEELPEGFGCLENLEELDVCSSAFTKLPSSFGKLKKLGKLHMQWCYELEELPEGFGCLESLEKLDVRYSAITKLPSSFLQLKKLWNLDMGSCKQLKELPEGFGCLESLEELNVSGLPITELPSSFGHLKKLRNLSMESCHRLEGLPEGFECLESLEVLNVSDSAITKLPSSFGQLKKLRKLDMFRCRGLEGLPKVPDRASCFPPGS